MAHPREEVQAAAERYHELRRRIDDGLEPDAFGVLADFYTEDAVLHRRGVGTGRGPRRIARWLVDSMVGMEDWKFPVEFTAIEGDDVVVKWTQIMPRTRADGTPFRQSGYSRLVYAGDGKFSYEEDAYNMAHVLEDIEASGWTRTVHERPAGPPRPELRHPGRAPSVGVRASLRCCRSCRSRGTLPRRTGWCVPPVRCPVPAAAGPRPGCRAWPWSSACVADVVGDGDGLTRLRLCTTFCRSSDDVDVGASMLTIASPCTRPALSAGDPGDDAEDRRPRWSA